MKLLRLKANGFGPLRGEYAFEPGRLALVVDENERGKSSLLSAIAAALYGLEDDRRRNKLITPVERWRPWDGGTYRVELEVESQGERLTITRDFDRQTVAVWNDRGQELTADYREGKDSFPVGKKLLGLDAEEFEKCTFWRQGDLEQVVAADERGRRESTLLARLENAADTRVGDTNAIEALHVLDEAAAQYTAPEIDTTLKVETAIARLSGKGEALGLEITAIEHDLAHIAEPLETLARLAERERSARDAAQRAEAERRESRRAELTQQLARDDEHRGDLDRLRREAAGLEAAPDAPAGSADALREAVARVDEKQRALESFRARRATAAGERTTLETEIATLVTYEACDLEIANRLAARAEEIRRLDGEHERLRGELRQSEAALNERGVLRERVEALSARFGALSHQQQDFLRAQPRLALAFQTETGAIDQGRAEAEETLRAIEGMRRRQRTPGVVLLAVGGAAVIAALLVWFSIVLTLTTPWLRITLVGAALACLAGGIALWAAASRVRRADHAAAGARLADAEERAGKIRGQRAEIGARLGELAAMMNFPSAEALLREWNDYLQLIEESGPLQRNAQQLGSLETQRQALASEASAMLARAGGGAPEPDHLDRAAAGIRQRLAATARLADFATRWEQIEAEGRAAEAALAEVRNRAVGILESAGLLYDAAQPWPKHLEALTTRVQASQRRDQLASELIPQAERLVMDEAAREPLRAELERLSAEALPLSTAGWRTPRAIPEIDRELERMRGEIDELSKQRSDERSKYEEKARQLMAGQAAKRSELVVVERAIERAQRFKRAIDLARTTIQESAFDTHRRWAEFLNVRVAEILGSVGTQIGAVRFGEDLDFSVKLASGQQAARGRAVLQLSSGARDQLHLAVRLAISEFLSRGREPVPILIDDAFATSDDERARAGMRLLIERFSLRHQIIVVTCHRQRHETLAALDHELYAERVQWLEAPKVETSGTG